MAVEVVSLKRALEMLQEAGVDPRLLESGRAQLPDLKKIRAIFRIKFPDVYMEDI